MSGSNVFKAFADAREAREWLESRTKPRLESLHDCHIGWVDSAATNTAVIRFPALDLSPQHRERILSLIRQDILVVRAWALSNGLPNVPQAPSAFSDREAAQCLFSEWCVYLDRLQGGKQIAENVNGPTKPASPQLTGPIVQHPRTSNRFHIALSFPGEQRDFVLEVAEALAITLGRDRVFYDEWYEAELLGSGGDLKLQSMYEQADLVIPFFSQDYSKPWCSMEWETIRGILLKRRKDDAVIPVHLDDTDIPGWSAVNFGIRVRGRTAQQIAEVIRDALSARNPDAMPQTRMPVQPSVLGSAPPSQPANMKPAPTSATRHISAALPIWQEKLDYLRQQEAIESNPGTKFSIKKQIEEAKQKIRELGGNP